MQDFAAIDFETVNRHRFSICSVGGVVVRDGEIVDRFYSLTQPSPLLYILDYGGSRPIGVWATNL